MIRKKNEDLTEMFAKAVLVANGVYETDGFDSLRRYMLSFKLKFVFVTSRDITRIMIILYSICPTENITGFRTQGRITVTTYFNTVSSAYKFFRVK